MRVCGLLALLLLCGTQADAAAQGIRERIRGAPRATSVTPSQAIDLTLTVTPVTVRPIQVWIRTSGRIAVGGRVLTAYLPSTEGAFVKAGQRARAFPVESRSSMYQARVSRVVSENGKVRVEAMLVAPPREGVTVYVLEIVTERGDFLSVPNEAIIEEGDRRVVYVQLKEGQYEPKVVTTGLQGELYTRVVDGVREGDQVVTFGSFFIDSDFKLKGTAQTP